MQHVFTLVRCAAVYSHLSIFAGAIASNGGNYGYVFVFSGKSLPAVCGLFESRCGYWCVVCCANVGFGLRFARVKMWVPVCSLLE